MTQFAAPGMSRRRRDPNAPMHRPEGGFRAHFPARRSYAALDLGTNNCRMLIARPDGDQFFIIDAFSRIVRLGEGLGATGRLSDAAMDRTVAALAVCADKLMKRNVHLSRSVATEACRRATNGAEFVERVYRETGIKLDVIAAEEEARLAVIGCHRLLEDGDGPALVFDIGGGSTELVIVDTSGDEPRTLFQQPIGSLGARVERMARHRHDLAILVLFPWRNRKVPIRTAWTCALLPMNGCVGAF